VQLLTGAIIIGAFLDWFSLLQLATGAVNDWCSHCLVQFVIGAVNDWCN
jgi:hypothetical protein